MRRKILLILLVVFAASVTSIPVNQRRPGADDDAIETKIVGGVNATRGEFPWMVSLQYNSFGTLRHMCGGAILNATHILTAAHCINNMNLEHLTAVAGAVRIFANEAYQQTSQPIRASVHPSFENIERVRHDIGILEIYPPFTLNSYVGTIQLPSQNHAAGGFCTMAGWGSGEYLLKITIPIVSDEWCNEFYGSEVDTNNQLCAGYQQGGYDFCSGDTGGPLVCNDLGYNYVAGIASFGYSCGAPNKPGIYTETARYTSGSVPPISFRRPPF